MLTLWGYRISNYLFTLHYGDIKVEAVQYIAALAITKEIKKTLSVKLYKGLLVLFRRGLEKHKMCLISLYIDKNS